MILDREWSEMDSVSKNCVWGVGIVRFVSEPAHSLEPLKLTLVQRGGPRVSHLLY